MKRREGDDERGEWKEGKGGERMKVEERESRRVCVYKGREVERRWWRWKEVGNHE